MNLETPEQAQVDLAQAIRSAVGASLEQMTLMKSPTKNMIGKIMNVLFPSAHAGIGDTIGNFVAGLVIFIVMVVVVAVGALIMAFGGSIIDRGGDRESILTVAFGVAVGFAGFAILAFGIAGCAGIVMSSAD
jgi:hypothetical protein